MKYFEVIEERAALQALDGMRDEKGRLVAPYRFPSTFRLEITRRLQRIQKSFLVFDEVRQKLNEAEPDENKRAKEMEILLMSDSGVVSKKWNETDLNLEENQIPVSILAVLLKEDNG